MDLDLQMFLERGPNLALMAALCLFLEAVVNMHPVVAFILRIFPAILGFRMGAVFYQSGYLEVALPLGISGLFSLFATFVSRPYWDWHERLAVNAIPLISFVVSAAVIKNFVGK